MRQALATGKISSRELVDLHIERIERLDGPLNSVVVRNFDEARQAAAASDARLHQGKGGALEGVPVTIKEAINLRGLPLTVGDPAHQGYV